jgi:8-oxo-dGTP pyrophosphatase MutT (NUDIX family)
MNSKIINCTEKCCELKYNLYERRNVYFENKRNKKKAGIFITDTDGKILLVQSKGNLWGCPKGTMKNFETELQCAIREVKEETGILITESDLSNSIIYNNNRLKATYFNLIIPNRKVEIQEHISGNDANGIGWIKPECLKKLILDRTVSINQHCRVVIERFLGLTIDR